MTEPSPLTAKLRRYGAFNSHDALKVIALALMVVDHAGWAFYTNDLWLRAIGRGAAPLFFFLIGFSPSYRIRANLVIAALMLAAVNTPLSGSLMNINILVSFMIARLLLARMESGKIPVTRPWDWFMLLVLLWPTTTLFHYGTPGLLFSYFGYLQKHAERYKRHDRAGILIGSLALYAALEIWLFKFDLTDAVLTLAVLAAAGTMMWRYRPRALDIPTSLQPITPPLAWVARYSLWIYTLHLIAIQLVTGVHY